MANNDEDSPSGRYNQPRNPSTPPQSIPLQDLSRPPGSQDITDYNADGSRGHARQGSSGLRSIFTGRGRSPTITITEPPGGAYGRVNEESPTSHTRRGLGMEGGGLNYTGGYYPPDTRVQHHDSNDDDGFDDVSNFAGLMDAIPFHPGFQGQMPDPVSPSEDSNTQRQLPGQQPQQLLPHQQPQQQQHQEYQQQQQWQTASQQWPIGASTQPTQASHEPRPSISSAVSAVSSGSWNGGDDFVPTGENDMLPLTQLNNMQPMAGSRLSPNSAAGGSPSRGVRFDSSSARLGDDLQEMEDGTLGTRMSRSRSRSLSPGAAASTLTRAGSLMRQMSQRVVNVSNAPEIVNQTMRRKSSVKGSPSRRPDGPQIPTVHEYAAESSNGPGPHIPIEKELPFTFTQAAPSTWSRPQNPLKGRSLGIFPGDNALRKGLCSILVHPITEPIILVLIVLQLIILSVDSSANIHKVLVPVRLDQWGKSWIDYGLLAIFIIYTVEIIAKIIVSGLVLNPAEYSTIDRSQGLVRGIIDKGKGVLQTDRKSKKKQSLVQEFMQPSIIRSLTGLQDAQAAEQGSSRDRARWRLARRAFLRHSFNRLDFVAVIAYWIGFALSLTPWEMTHHVHVFRMMSCLRILRLLGITNGTSVILRSLKKASSLLLRVAFLIGFFWLLFAIIGLQSFKSSFRRECVWVDPEGIDQNFTNSFQFCGGYINATNGNEEPWLYPDGRRGATKHKGFLCPVNSFCIQGDNPYNGTLSFDNIGNSLMSVFVVMSANTFTDLMYYTTYSDYLIASLFFVAGIAILTLWLVNLLIAVITSSFQVIREEGRQSAFAAQAIDEPVEVEEKVKKRNRLATLFKKTEIFWLLVITYGLVCQTLRSARMGEDRAQFITISETIVTFVLALEIVLRFASDWRGFFRSNRNWVDLTLAVVTCIVQIPVIHNSGEPYAWLTIFQILRAYRLILGVKLTRDLLTLVLGNFKALGNLILFVMLVTYLCAIFAVQMFRGEIPAQTNGNTVRVTFHSVWNSFLGMYQILSSENWTTILYGVNASEVGFNTAWIASGFFILWFILANFIVLNMFIAVIQENFDISEDEKLLQQVRSFVTKGQLNEGSGGNTSFATILRLRKGEQPNAAQTNAAILLKGAIVDEFLSNTAEDEEMPPVSHRKSMAAKMQAAAAGEGSNIVSSLWEALRARFFNKEPNPFHSNIAAADRSDLGAKDLVREVFRATELRKQAQRDYLMRHPTYDRSLFLFKQSNPIRRFCQRLVAPGHGSKRYGDGLSPIPVLSYPFSAFIYCSIVAMVLIACVTTPLYQRDYYSQHGRDKYSWFFITDIAFTGLFTLEALIKVIADGAFWTPNAWLRGSWGFIDFVVLITLFVDVISGIKNEGTVTRAIGAFKALRALRLLNISDNARDTFQSVIVFGGWKLLSAAFVSIGLLVPYAIYGLNLYNGLMISCNDSGSGIDNLDDCVGEYASSPYNWNVLAPRVVSNSYFDFDNFGHSLFTLFQIVSQEGWTDVMYAAINIVGLNRQPEPFNKEYNGIFFVTFNLLGSVFILTLFVSILMRNYTERTGVAFLTAEQRSWLELEKLLQQISPSKRPGHSKSDKIRSWCYKQSYRKQGTWQRFITGVLVLHVLVLCIEFYPGSPIWEKVRDFLFLLFILIFLFNSMIRLIGFGYTRFRKSSWNVYSLAITLFTLCTNIWFLTGGNTRLSERLNKIGLVGLALMLIPRNNQLDQLFKTAAASLASIMNLVAAWFVLYLVYAIALTQTFGLTKFGQITETNINLRDVPKALLLLFRMSYGEGWNQIMTDFEIQEPNCVNSSDFYRSDCGSPNWARALFVSWNIISMYIFVNLFISLIYESFSFVYQRSGGLSALSRDEIRRFKQAWSTFDPNGTGKMSKADFPRLLGELSGIFEMRIYRGDFTVSRLLEESRQQKTQRRFSESPYHTGKGGSDELDMATLRHWIESIPVHEIRARRKKFNLFYEEVLASATSGYIEFGTVLLTIAQYNIVSDKKCLVLQDYLKRKAKLARVEDAIRLNIVRGLISRRFWMKKFQQHKDMKANSKLTTPFIAPFAVPQIFVENEDEDGKRQRVGAPDPLLSPSSDSPNIATPDSSDAEAADSHGPLWGALSRELARTSKDTRASEDGDIAASDEAYRSHRHQQTVSSVYSNTIQPGQISQGTSRSPSLSPSGSPTRSPFIPQRPELRIPLAPLDTSSARLSPGDNISPSGSPTSSPLHSRQGSAVSARDVLDVLEDSDWGRSIRRSFTNRRPGAGDGSRGGGASGSAGGAL